MDDATRLAEGNYGKCPDVNIKLQDPNIRFAYIPSDLHYIFFELMKNSMRAVCEHYNDSDTDSDDLPPIECVVVASQQSDDVTIKISDQGGGISRENMEKIWYYSFTTITRDQQPSMNPNENHNNYGNSQPMAGFVIYLFSVFVLFYNSFHQYQIVLSIHKKSCDRRELRGER